VIWHQTYLLFGHGLAFSALLASLPIVTLLLLLGVFRRPAWIAALSGLLVTFLLATLAYRMPVPSAISAALHGAAFGLLPISWIVFWAIALFRVTVDMGQFEIIKDSIGQLTADPRLQALIIAFAFGAFLEGAAGFGTPVAIAAAMLIGLGFSPFSASAICLLANTAPVAFGSIGIPVVTLAITTGLPLLPLSAAVGRICAPMSLLIPLYSMAAIGGLGSLTGIWIPTLLAGASFALVQFCVSNFIGPQLTDILAGLASMAAMFTYLKLKRSTSANHADLPAARRFAHMGATPAALTPRRETLTPNYTTPQVLYAWLPYALLVVCVLLWGWMPLQTALNSLTIMIKWPMLHDLVYRMPPIVKTPSPYHAIYAFTWAGASGTACMVATILAALCLRMPPRHFLRVLWEVTLQLRLPTITVTAVLALAFLMNYCGATATLGLAFAATGALFPFFSALLGWIGVFLTGSDTSANALFGNLQVVTATRLGFNPTLMAAASSTGGVMGKMISLQTIAIAAAATGLSPNEQVKLFRFTLKHSLLLASLVGLITLLYAYVLHL
jgi:L-lactate transport